MSVTKALICKLENCTSCVKTIEQKSFEGQDFCSKKMCGLTLSEQFISGLYNFSTGMRFNIFLAILSIIFISATSFTLQSHQGTDAWYTFNQAPTGNRCKNNSQCDGLRTCSQWGWCQGTSRPKKSISYYYNEGKTGNRCPELRTDPNYVNRHYYCDGLRTCSQWGWCQGKSR